jgi:sphingosine kinase
MVDSMTSLDSSGNASVSLYNILWAELADRCIKIDCAFQSTKQLFTHTTMSFDLPTTDSFPNDISPENFVSTLIKRAYGQAKPQKRGLVLINPSSGPGGAVRKWEREAKPLFDAARLQLDVVTLTRGGEAMELAENVELGKYDTIISCSGDGTPHEIFNGLAKRPDAGTALRTIAISHVPCGSGNGMAINLYGSNQVSVAALGIIKGIVTPMDLVSVTFGSSRLLSFLSQSVGIVAESDLGTEHLRWMGSTRFEVGLLMSVFQKRCYPCDLAVKVEIEDKQDIKAYYKRFVEGGGPQRSIKEGEAAVSAGQGLPELKYGTAQDELPDGWELVPHDKLSNFYCGNVGHPVLLQCSRPSMRNATNSRSQMAFMAPNANFFPASIMSDGCMDLVMVNADIPRVTATKTLLAVETGKFFDMPHVSYRKISAFRLIPRNQEDGFISVDGEKIPFGPFQAEVHKGLGRVISKRGVFEAEGPTEWQLAKMN